MANAKLGSDEAELAASAHPRRARDGCPAASGMSSSGTDVQRRKIVSRIQPISMEALITRYVRLALVAVVGAALAIVIAGTAPARAASLKQQIVGTWAYVSVENVK